MADFYMVRAGSQGYLAEDFRSKGLVALGWNELDDLSIIRDLDHLKVILEQHYPNKKKGWIAQTAGQLRKFLWTMKEGDYVLTYDSSARIYYFGKIASKYFYDSSYEFYHQRKVDWICEIDRDDLTLGTRNILGSTLTVFYLPEEQLDEFLSISKGEKPAVIEEDEEDQEVTLDLLLEDLMTRSKELIKDEIQKLDFDEMELFVAGVLNGMGYKARVMPKGTDRGKDIIASPDGLGLEDPRIFVEVKHRVQRMGAPEIRAFIGGLREGARGLYVSTGGFSKEAKYEAERSMVPITLVDIDFLTDLYVEHYDNLSVEMRSRVPLKKLYWPI